MKFSTVKYTTLGLLVAGLAIGCFGVFALEEGTSSYTFTAILMLVLFAAGLLVAFIWGRCPNCGHRLFYRLLKWKDCPYCRHKIDMKGRYVKKVKKKQTGGKVK